jgi:hypothetical protein
MMEEGYAEASIRIYEGNRYVDYRLRVNGNESGRDELASTIHTTLSNDNLTKTSLS